MLSRRYVWKHIDAVKEGRVVLLMTHAMEEADLLADQVAIIRNGVLVKLGSPLELRLIELADFFYGFLATLTSCAVLERHNSRHSSRGLFSISDP